MRLEWNIDWRADLQAFQSHVAGKHWKGGQEVKSLTVLLPDEAGGLADPDRVQEIGMVQVAEVFGALTDPGYEGPARSLVPLQPVCITPIEEILT